MDLYDGSDDDDADSRGTRALLVRMALIELRSDRSTKRARVHSGSEERDVQDSDNAGEHEAEVPQCPSHGDMLLRWGRKQNNGTRSLCAEFCSEP